MGNEMLLKGCIPKEAVTPQRSNIPYIPLRASLGLTKAKLLSPHNAQQILTSAKNCFAMSGTTKT